MVKIHKDNTKKNKWYAVTDRGVIHGGSAEIVQRKIDRLGAKEKVYNKEVREQTNTEEFEFPF